MENQIIKGDCIMEIENKTKKGFSQIEFCKFEDKIGNPIEQNQGYVDVKETFEDMYYYLKRYLSYLREIPNEGTDEEIAQENDYINALNDVMKKARKLF